jgi:hypothetical protein
MLRPALTMLALVGCAVDVVDLHPVAQDPDQTVEIPSGVVEEPVNEVSPPAPVAEAVVLQAPNLSIPDELRVPAEPAFQRAEQALEEGRGIVAGVFQLVNAALSGLPLAPCPTGVAAWRGGQPYPTLTAANAAGSADPVLLICPGTWAEQLEISEDRLLAPAIPFTRPVLDAAGGPVLAGGAGSLGMIGLDITGATDQAAVAVSPGTFVAVDLDVHHNGDPVAGGSALNVTSDRAVVVASRFGHNASGYAAGALDLTSDHAVVIGNEFHDNFADYEGGAATFIHDTWNPSSGTIVIALNHWEGNEAGYEGGAYEIGIRWAPFDVVTIGNEVHDNHADYSGGGVQGSPGDGELAMFFDTYTGNTSRGGAALDFGSWDVADIVIYGATATDNDGGQTMAFDPAGSPRTGSLRFVGGTFASNDAGTVLSWDPHWDVVGQGVNFGVGAQANTGADLVGCGPAGANADFLAIGGQVVACP